MFIDTLVDRLVGKAFQIDCHDIEIYKWHDFEPPIFNGPGIIKGAESGQLSFTLFNRQPMTTELWHYICEIERNKDSQHSLGKLVAKDYDGVEWGGSWFLPRVGFDKTAAFKVHGAFDTLSARIQKFEGDPTKDATELVYTGKLRLPFAGIVREKHFHGEDVILEAIRTDHHELEYEGARIVFQEQSSETRTHIMIQHGGALKPPHAENWVNEAIILVTAQIRFPRMIIRHFQHDALVFVRGTREDTVSGMPRCFFPTKDMRDVDNCIWDVFLAYLSQCVKTQSFEYLPLTRAFMEVITASTATVQAFTLSLAMFVEFCLKEIASVTQEERSAVDAANALRKHVREFSSDAAIKDRALRLLSMLGTPDLSETLDLLTRGGVVTHPQKVAWKESRHRLAHGGLIDFPNAEEYWHHRNHLIAMLYRLIFFIVGYRGMALEYNGEDFQFADFDWSVDGPPQNVAP